MNEVETVASTGGRKGVKPEIYSTIPYPALRAVAEVYYYGAEKYDDEEVGPYNFWRGYEWSKNYNAMMRHILAFWNGEDLDPESDLPHMAHAVWHGLALLFFMEEHRELDDRPRIVVK